MQYTRYEIQDTIYQSVKYYTKFHPKNQAKSGKKVGINGRGLREHGEKVNNADFCVDDSMA
jgi:hypothetical protein